MKMPNRAVKMGGIFAVGAGLVAIALSVVLLVPNTTQAHPEPTPQTVIVATPEPTSQPASALGSVPDQTSQQAGPTAQEISEMITAEVATCVGWDGHSRSTGQPWTWKGNGPIEMGELVVVEKSDSAMVCTGAGARLDSESISEVTEVEPPEADGTD